MKTLKRHVRDYLELRRGLGFDLGRVELRLKSFIEFLKVKRTRQITTALALEFALRPDHPKPGTQAGCLSAIRGFARYLTGIEPKTEVPPTGLVRLGTVLNRISTPTTRLFGYWMRPADILQRRDML